MAHTTGLSKRVDDLEAQAPTPMPEPGPLEHMAAWVDCLSDAELDDYLGIEIDLQNPSEAGDAIDAFIANLDSEKRAMHERYEQSVADLAGCDLSHVGEKLDLLHRLGAFEDPDPGVVPKPLWRYVRALEKVIQDEEKIQGVVFGQQQKGAER